MALKEPLQLSLVLGLMTLCQLAACQTLPGANTAFNASLIVANVSGDCPVPIKKWNSTEFNLTNIIQAFLPLLQSAPQDGTCPQQATALASCAFDGTLEVKEGCCSIACARKMQILASNSCLPIFVRYFCTLRANATILNAATLAKPLLGAAQRCTGFVPETLVQCPDGGVLDVTALVEGRAQATTPAVEPGAPAAGGVVPAAPGPAAVLEAAAAQATRVGVVAAAPAGR